MRNKGVSAAGRFALAVGLMGGNASAGVMIVDFEVFDLPPNEPIAFFPGEPVLVSEFLFTQLELTDSHYGNAVIWWGYNGTHVTGYHDSVLMEREDGAEFDLVAFDYAGPPVVEAPITVIASNGSIVGFIPDGQTDGPDGVEDFETFVLPGGFANITSVTFVVVTEWHLDNVVWALPDSCPWDCDSAESTDGTVGIVDFLTLLAQWGGPGSCDFDGGGVGITDFLELLAHWGACP